MMFILNLLIHFPRLGMMLASRARMYTRDLNSLSIMTKLLEAGLNRTRRSVSIGSILASYFQGRRGFRT